MNNERYEKFKELMEAVKDIVFVDISLSDYDDYFTVSFKLVQEEEAK